MRWFKHRVDAHTDIKIQKLCREFGSAGYATFFYCLELIGKEGKDGRLALNKYNPADIAFFLSEKPEVIDKTLKRAIEIGLFVKEGEETLFCPKLVNGYSDEWSNRRRSQHVLDILESSGELRSAQELTKKETSQYIETVKEVLAHLNNLTGKQYRWQSKDNQLLITARLKEGYTKEMLLKVIENQCERWLGDEKMEQYLRPTTIFCRSKIEGYLNNDKGLASKMKNWGKK
jgi:uncharacterized phage protein (TIGR02220 family)